jgi:hypothetical protein
MGVPYTFGGQVGNVNASELDADFNYLTAGTSGGGGGGAVYGPGGGGTGSSTGLGLIFVAVNPGGVGGSANAITLTTSVVPTSIQFGMHFIFVPLYVNTGNTTLNINGTGAFPLYVDSNLLTGGELSPLGGVRVYYSINGSAYGMERINDGNTWYLPQNSQSAAYGLVISDQGKMIYHPSADTNARTFTIPANASVAYQIGTCITFINDVSAGALTIAITSDTLNWSPSGGTGSRVLTAPGVATAVKTTATSWMISGSGLS